MKRIQLRDLRQEERKTLKRELKSQNRTVVWRSQAILMSVDEGLTPEQIGQRVGYSRESVRQVLHKFDEDGIVALYPQSRARKDEQRAYNDEARKKLQALVRHSPRDFDCESSLWSLALLAEVSYAEGLTDRVVHPDTVAQTLHQLGVDWKKAKRHIQSPDEHYERKKSDVIG